MSRGFRLEELARCVGGTVVGDPTVVLHGVATLDAATPDQISFLINPRYRRLAQTTRAGAIIAKPGAGVAGRPLLEVAEPYLALAQVIELFHPAEARPASVSQRAEIAADAVLGTDVSVGPFAVIEAASVIGDRVRIGAGTVVGRGSRVGDDSRLMPRVVLYPGTVVGRRCIIHSGVVLGGDGFGFATSAGRHHKVPHIGHVAVGDDVEIGANTTVDRGALTATEIGSGSKLDNLVMIAHGVVVGDGCLIAAQSGIAGSARVGARVTLAGQVGVVGHVKIADGTVVASKSAVMQDVERGQLIAGIPAVDHREWKRAQALSRKLPELRAEMRELSRRIDQLEHRSPEED